MIVRKFGQIITFTFLLVTLFGSCTMMKEIDQISIGNPDLSMVKDGRWIGSCSTSLVSAETAVTVTNHRINNIDILRHDCGLGKPAEAIVDRVIAAQSLQVDAVSGATGSSKVILKSIEVALKKGMEGSAP